MTRKILVLAANPKKTSSLRLDEEIREIDKSLRLSRNREQFSLEKQLAVKIEDLRRSLLDEEPHFVHFCGHGAGDDGLVVEDITGKPQFVKAEALANLFKLFSNQIDCVILNACYSEVQAQAISQHIKYVIGMKQAIGDRAAIQFATGFYDAIGAGRGIEDAFEFGKNAIELQGISEELTPIIRKNGGSQDNELKSERQIDYRKLQSLLSAKKWKEADEETLAIMLQIAERDKEGWLDVEDIQAFPSVDLSTLNQLWFKYSNGKFGFTIQKRLYIDSGGKLDGLYHPEAWKEFSAKVEWSIDNHWISYRQVGFYTSAPNGHLPVWWGGRGWRLGCAEIDLDSICVLFSRRDLLV